MEQIGQYALGDSHLTDKAAAIGNALWHVAERVILILAVLAFTYSIVAAEVALAEYEQIGASVPR